MDQPSTENLDEIILEEKRLVAQEHFLDAWLGALEDGIDTEIIAKTLVKSALDQLAKVNGDSAVSALVREISVLEENGEFIPGKILQ